MMTMLEDYPQSKLVTAISGPKKLGTSELLFLKHQSHQMHPIPMPLRDKEGY